jgi:hypothetical protein
MLGCCARQAVQSITGDIEEAWGIMMVNWLLQEWKSHHIFTASLAAARAESTTHLHSITGCYKSRNHNTSSQHHWLLQERKAQHIFTASLAAARAESTTHLHSITGCYKSRNHNTSSQHHWLLQERKAQHIFTAS